VQPPQAQKRWAAAIDGLRDRSLSWLGRRTAAQIEEGSMRSRLTTAAFLAGIVLIAGACATSEEWAEWRAHPTHWASGEHLAFSARNTEGRTPLVTRADISNSRAQSWWGRVITVSPDQIFQN
jgi:hypothetical protein